jgi:hypothetical protein
MSITEQMIINQTSEPHDTDTIGQQYDVFRKKFHVPKAWDVNEEFKQLVEHRYFTSAANESFSFIAGCLQRMGYDNDNDAIVHDYLHFMICDLLASENIPFISEADIRQSAELTKLFANLTPDLIIKSAPEYGRPKPYILDVYIGRSDKVIQEKKSKYKTIGICFDFDGVTPSNMSSVLVKFVSQQAVNYLFRQFQIFLTEHHYWRACLKLKKILSNDTENVRIVQYPDPSENYDLDTQKFITGLRTKASQLLDNDGV